MVETPETKVEFSDIQMRALSVLLDRQLFMRATGMQFDGRRDLYNIFGYDRLVTATQYREEYARGGIAKRIIEAFPKATWRGGVELYEDENPKNDTEFEKAFDALNKKHHVWTKLQNADILAGQSTYSVILIGAPGSLEEELPRSDKLLYLQPFFGGGGPGSQGQSSSTRTQATDADVTIDSFDVDPASERFGEPLTYRIKRTDLASPMLSKPVHWTRVVHFCEGALDNNVYGVPTLESVWNLLFDLEKITGGGAESAYQRSKHVLNANIQKDAKFAPSDIAEMKTLFAEFQHNITTFLPTREMDVKLLEATVSNFGQNADAVLKQIAGSKGIPMRILTGSEMGSLASEQDAANFDSQVQDRRTSYAGPMMVRKLVDRLIEYGYLPTPAQYEVGWPTEEEDQNEQADFAVKLATVNQTQGETVITDEEIREMAFDLDPLTEAQKKAIADRAAEKVQQAQEAMIATQPPAEPGADPKDKKPTPFGKPALKAAEDAGWLRVLETAIQVKDRKTIDRILFGLEAMTVQSAIDMLSSNSGADDFIMAKEFVAVVGELTGYDAERLATEFEDYKKRHGMGFDGRRDA